MTDAALEDRPISKSIRPLLMLVPFITPYWRTLVLALVALLLSSAAVLLMPMAVRDVIDHGFSSEAASQIDQYFFVLMGFAVLIGVFGAARVSFKTTRLHLSNFTARPNLTLQTTYFRGVLFGFRLPPPGPSYTRPN